jgi:hypothetical protein
MSQNETLEMTYTPAIGDAVDFTLRTPDNARVHFRGRITQMYGIGPVFALVKTPNYAFAFTVAGADLRLAVGPVGGE